MYKKRLIALLEGLECQHIDELIEKSQEHLKAIGLEITKHAKVGALSDIAVLTNAMHLDGEGRGTKSMGDILREALRENEK